MMLEDRIMDIFQLRVSDERGHRGCQAQSVSWVCSVWGSSQNCIPMCVDFFACMLYYNVNLILFFVVVVCFNTESPDRQQENKVYSLYRKIQMLFLKKGFLFCHGCGHMVPSNVNCHVPGSGRQSQGREAACLCVQCDGVNCLSFPNAYITVKWNNLYHHEGQEFPSYLCISPQAFWFSLDKY